MVRSVMKLRMESDPLKETTISDLEVEVETKPRMSVRRALLS
jgi:hypothetical protein